MVEWLKYSVRVFASVILVSFSVIMLALAACDPKIRTFGAGVGVVFGMAGLFTWPRRPNAWRRDPPTDRQVAYAVDLGIRVRPGMSKGELSDLISQAKSLRDTD